MTAKLELIQTDLLDDHPKNPRVVFREDVIEGIVANLNGDWPQQHALHVRPLGDRYQILAGHHRKRAADKAGIDSVWCWVEDIDDDSAYMQLATTNNQGEMSPLEIGLHALHCESLSKGGRGKKGGLSAYAERLGQKHQAVSRNRAGAKVFEAIKPATYVASLQDRVAHLSEIGKLPKSCWEKAVEWLTEKNWSHAEVKKRVDEARGIEWEPTVDGYLPKSLVQLHIYGGRKLAEFGRLDKLAKAMCDELANHEDLQAQWLEFLRGNEESLDITKCQEKRTELEGLVYDRENSEPPSELADVLLADPPWRYDSCETTNRKVENQYPTAARDNSRRSGVLTNYSGTRRGI